MFRFLCCTSLLLGGLVMSGAAYDATEQKPADVLTLADALDLALQNSPALKAFSWQVRAADARILQAGLRPNPEATLEIEDLRLFSGPGVTTQTASFNGAASADTASIPFGIGGQSVSLPILNAKPGLGMERAREQGPRSGLSEAEITLSVSQLIELGGKRAKRVQVARREQELAQWDYEAERANVIEAVATAYVNVLAGQRRLVLQSELSQLAEQVHETVSKQVQAGAVSPLELNRAAIELQSTRIEQERAARELESARVALAITWGQKGATFDEVAGRLEDVYAVPTLDALQINLRSNPDVARWATESTQRDAAFRLARAQRIPNPTVSFGFRTTGIENRGESTYSFDTDGGFGFSRSRSSGDSSRDNRFVLGFSIPLPVFDRNQGNIQEAEFLIRKSGEEQRAAENAAYSSLAEAYHAVSAAHKEIETLTQKILPTATETFDKIQEGYRQGKFGYLEVLDAERTLFDARRQYIDALTTYHQKSIRLERLTGIALAPEVPHSPNQETTSNGK